MTRSLAEMAYALRERELSAILLRLPATALKTLSAAFSRRSVSSTRRKRFTAPFWYSAIRWAEALALASPSWMARVMDLFMSASMAERCCLMRRRSAALALAMLATTPVTRARSPWLRLRLAATVLDSITTLEAKRALACLSALRVATLEAEMERYSLPVARVRSRAMEMRLRAARLRRWPMRRTVSRARAFTSWAAAALFSSMSILSLPRARRASE